MPSRVVVQPDGKLAIFSTIVDTFTAVNMTTEYATKLLVWRGCRLEEAEDAVLRGQQELNSGKQSQRPLYRWNEAISTIRAVHGENHLAELSADIETDGEPHER